MSSFGTSAFGAASYGGDIPPYLLFDIDAEITARARNYLARGSMDGTSIKVVSFSVGTGGADLFDYRVATPVDTDAIDLEAPTPILVGPPDIMTKLITQYEHPNPMASCAYCQLDAAEGNDVLSEVALWAEVLKSPYQYEDPNLPNPPPIAKVTFLAAIGHFPVKAKNSSMQYALRVNVQF